MITIKAEMSAGCSIDSAFKEAKEVAIKLNCFIDFDFNGIHCTASPTSKLENVMDVYLNVIRSKSEYKYMCI